MSLERQKEDWDHLGRVDPLWAIYTKPDKKFGAWESEEFFLTGVQDVERVMSVAAALGLPARRELALDFGCGVGRLTRALAAYFEQCYGVDISESMILRARELNAAIPRCTFWVNAAEHLRMFPDNHFDMIYTKWVLQHLPSKDAIKTYVSEFVRTLKADGLLVFQLRTRLPLVVRIQPRRRLHGLLRALGVGGKFCHERLGLDPMRMTAIPEAEVAELLSAIGARVLEVQAYAVGRGQDLFRHEIMMSRPPR